MTVLAAIPLFLALGFLFVAGVGAVGGYLLYVLLSAGQRSLQGPSGSPQVVDTTAAAPAAAPRPQRAAPSRSAAPADDLFAVPRRLAGLEEQLAGSLAEARKQADHLRSRRERIAAKDDRAELVARYEEDARLLDRRAENMERVLGMVWRTRAVLLLRAHVAETARRRPDLHHLPQDDAPPPVGALAELAERYEAAASEVRDFVVSIEGRLADLTHVLPRAPRDAAVGAEDQQAVDDELSRARATYTSLQNRMDRLADTLSYLSDRCHTRQVVAGAEVSLDAGAGTSALLDEVSGALEALNDLSRMGDRALADSALDNLEEDISQLEQAGLDARAAAEAELEIERLLDTYSA
jgi:hypothetical protein